jgi:hypothetical protein
LLGRRHREQICRIQGKGHVSWNIFEITNQSLFWGFAWKSTLLEGPETFWAPENSPDTFFWILY